MPIDRDPGSIEESNLAKRIRGLDGADSLEEQPDVILDKPKTFREKLANYWYHYRWPTLIGVVLLAFATVCMIQITSKTEADIYILYAGPASLTPEGITSIQNDFAVFDNDRNGDGKHVVSLLDLVVYTEAQMAELKAEAEENGEAIQFNESMIRQERERFSSEIMIGDSLLCLLDPHMYESVHDAGGFQPLSEILTDIPAGVEVYDDCAVVLSSTDFGKYFSGVSNFPADTLLCVRRTNTLQGTFGSREKAEALQKYHADLFKSIVTYQSANHASASNKT